MGCHTSFNYVPKPLKIGEMKKELISCFSRLIRSNDYSCEEIKQFKKNIKNVKYNWSKNRITKEWQIRNTSKYDDTNPFLMSEGHDCFRVGLYPDIKICSYVQFLDAIKNGIKAGKGHYDTKTGNRKLTFPCTGDKIMSLTNPTQRDLEVMEFVKDFFEKYPDGYINFY